MGTIIEQLSLTRGGWRSRHSALHLASAAARSCLNKAGCRPDDLDLLLNAGLYRDRNLGEPALAALIQDDIGAHPEDPHTGDHGTFSFDVANGTCGVLTALQIVDGFLRSRVIERALIVASDADPGHGLSERFPFSAVGGAALCCWTDDHYGLGQVHWVNRIDGGDSFRATVGQNDNRNVLRFHESSSLDEDYAAAGYEAVATCLQEAKLELAEVDSVVAAPARPGFRAALAAKLGMPESRVTVADDEHMHTAALIAALEREERGRSTRARTVLVAVGAGVTAGAALYDGPPIPEEKMARRLWRHGRIIVKDQRSGVETAP
ncbi:3-oxoacyl-ACP synthase [Rhodococcus sp. AD45-ID]|uniref:3-oxoacyl-[acyl-carrier-protein] synthase III C-terminal domain-containing protein n=1 Tax=unclassified Rhodococcus (in: high G+C Gram-positive bacteria) TaxID=192944 RepID=UPI0005DC9E96|nr:MULTISPECIES: 3-oxoacyl-[acyl-carrier-protein] synthase III C-terminal domain-containing protein [unclassified Rhodococcus (in: high G+C Gram-positive bacteria)]KJF22606.1 3-oxoacyl-(acyl-carrier-protein) synthase 3 [Rhodococcus sp. AD45]PSR40205.1 3-oxoacyl-ACP synthase [Rhodococcus sp. AD45-ID]